MFLGLEGLFWGGLLCFFLSFFLAKGSIYEQPCPSHAQFLHRHQNMTRTRNNTKPLLHLKISFFSSELVFLYIYAELQKNMNFAYVKLH